MDHNSSSGSSDMNATNDAEGVWSPDIDQAFHEALQIYPPCGRRKIILSDEGKMYGRNELIARYIKLRCGKTRTRKQVSSHIQVLARKKQREAKTKDDEDGPNQFLMPHSSSTSPAQHLALSVSHPSPSMISSPFVDMKPMINPNNGFDPFLGNFKIEPNAAPIAPLWPQNFNNGFLQPGFVFQQNGNDENKQCMEALINALTLQGSNLITPPDANHQLPPSQTNNLTDFIVASQKLVLCGFVAYIESNETYPPKRHELFNIPKVFDEPFERIRLGAIKSKYPQELEELFLKGPIDAFFLFKCWVNISFEIQDAQKALYAVDSYYKSLRNSDITVSTKVCIIANQGIEKIEVYSPTDEAEHINNLTFYNFQLEKSPMCEFVVAFINTLKNHGDREEMNSVLDNFTLLQTVKDQNGEILMVICFAFEISPDDEGSCRVYRLVG